MAEPADGVPRGGYRWQWLPFVVFSFLFLCSQSQGFKRF